MRGIYAQRLEMLTRLVRKHLAGFAEPRVPVGGLQMPCLLTCDISEQAFLEAARRSEIELLGLSAHHATGEGKVGFLLGFAAYTPIELEIAVRKLEKIFHTLNVVPSAKCS